MSTEPKLVQAPVHKKPANGARSNSLNKPRSNTPNRPAGKPSSPSKGNYRDPTSLTTADAAEGTEAFRNRISEITSFKVVSRVRPFIPEELAEMEGQERRSVIEMTDDKTILLDPKSDWTPKAQFEFDASFWSIPPSHKLVHTFHDTRKKEYATQKDVYDYIAKDLVPHVFNSFNSCILTYGQTGSGKTYTMMGNYDPKKTIGEDGEEGIIPRVSNDLFILLEERQQKEQELPRDERSTYRVEVSFVEIYMERVRDLLDPALRHTRGNEKLQDARIRQDPYSGPFVEGVTKYQVENWAQCCTLLERGSTHRTTCATAVHNQSSRSHAIYQITVVQERIIPAKDRYSKPTKKTQAGRINLVDLAGSERGGFQDYVKESAAINTSLLALRRVIDNLTERQNILIEQARAEITGTDYQARTMPQVPFRDSVLTWLLSDSIGGNARTTMVATLSPLVKNYGDNLATLQWSSKARNLVTLVKMNDQSVVQDGMTQHAGELGNAAQIQRQNLDSLRDTLRFKQQEAERYEKEAHRINASLRTEKEKLNKVERDRAALLIQRAFHKWKHYKKLSQLDKSREQARKMVLGNDAELQRLDKLKQDAERKEADAKKRLAAAEKTTADYAAQVAAVDAKRGEFEQEKEAAMAEHAAMRERMHADDVCREHAEKVKKEVEATKGALDKAKKDKEENVQKLQMMRDKVEEAKTEEWRNRVQQDESELAALRAKRDELKQKRDAAIAERDRVREKHAKLFKNKKK